MEEGKEASVSVHPVLKFGKHPSEGQKQRQMGRKKEERAARVKIQFSLCLFVTHHPAVPESILVVTNRIRWWYLKLFWSLSSAPMPSFGVPTASRVFLTRAPKLPRVCFFVVCFFSSVLLHIRNKQTKCDVLF